MTAVAVKVDVLTPFMDSYMAVKTVGTAMATGGFDCCGFGHSGDDGHGGGNGNDGGDSRIGERGSGKCVGIKRVGYMV